MLFFNIMANLNLLRNERAWTRQHEHYILIGKLVLQYKEELCYIDSQALWWQQGIRKKTNQQWHIYIPALNRKDKRFKE